MITKAVEGLPAVHPTLLWWGLGGDERGARVWVYRHLGSLGYGRHPAGFMWRLDVPVQHANRLVAFMDHLDEVYPDED